MKAEASKLYLSHLWWVIEPLLFVYAFYFVFRILLQNQQEDFLLFLLCAKIPYMWFSKSVTNASGSIIANGGIISQLDISKAIFPYSSIQLSLYKEIPVFVVLVCIAISYGYFPDLQWLWLLPLFVLEYVLIVAFGMLTAFTVCYVNDARMIISMGMLFLMFASGIFFDISIIAEPMRTYLLVLNPVAFLCDGFRTILMNKGMYSLQHLSYLMVLSLALLVVVHVVYLRLSKAIAARVVSG
jgi:lipopolysaccharide transport system permease protein